VSLSFSMPRRVLCECECVICDETMCTVVSRSPSQRNRPKQKKKISEVESVYKVGKVVVTRSHVEGLEQNPQAGLIPKSTQR
jgi:hypothetical protein